MDEYMIVLRIIHVGAACYWLGASIFLAGVMSPTVASSGESGRRFFLYLNQQKRYGMSFPLAGILTILSGFLLYERLSAGFNMDWIQSRPGVALSIGGILGVIAMFYGGAVHGKLSFELTELAQKLAATENESSFAQNPELNSLLEHEHRAGYVTVVLVGLSLILMVSARYLYG